MAEQSSTALGCATIGILIALGLFGCAVNGAADDAQEKAKAAAAQSRADTQQAAEDAKEEAAKIADGTHCVSGWDNTLPALNDAVKEHLRNPHSFEHISTSWSHMGKDGKFGLVMRYRAQNGFGGMNVEAVSALVDARTCRFEEVSPYTLVKRMRADPSTS